MKKYIIAFGFLSAIVSVTSCKKSAFEEFYRDPSKVSSTTIDKQFAGLFYNNRDLVVPSYGNYFVIMRNTTIRYLQATGWANESNQLTPGGASIGDRWNIYYGALAQYKELEALYSKLSEVEQKQYRIFLLTAKIFFYDQTQQVVDLHGSIPWSKAGLLNSNGGDYTISKAPYDDAESIYTTMLDELKSISDELNTITVESGILNGLKKQDIVNGGDITRWKQYCNSLRVRMLLRVSGASAFQARASAELGQIFGNSSTYPIVLADNENIQIKVSDPTTPISASGLKDALESWNANIAGKKMVDMMKSTADPRLRVMFEPGEKAGGVYNGLDQSLTSGVQTNLINGGTISIYNRSTYSRNQYFPGILISAAEMNFALAEYYLKNGSTANAKTAFENGVKASIEMLYKIRSVSNDNTVTAPAAPTTAEINTYINNLNWAAASDKMQLVATQKWLHFNIIQPMQSWAEVRRLDYPTFSFVVQASDIQKTPPVKWNLPASEVNFNTENYAAVKAQDNVNTKLFWDVN